MRHNLKHPARAPEVFTRQAIIIVGSLSVSSFWQAQLLADQLKHHCVDICISTHIHIEMLWHIHTPHDSHSTTTRGRAVPPRVISVCDTHWWSASNTSCNFFYKCLNTCCTMRTYSRNRKKWQKQKTWVMAECVCLWYIFSGKELLGSPEMHGTKEIATNVFLTCMLSCFKSYS